MHLFYFNCRNNSEDNLRTLPSAKAAMTLPRADSDLLMFLASSRTAPSAPVLLTYEDQCQQVVMKMEKS